MKFADIADWADSHEYPVSFMCRQPGASRSGYYARRASEPSAHARTDQTLTALITAISAQAQGTSGVLNRTGLIVKVGWTSSGEFGGGWHLRVGLLRNPANANQALRHIDFGSTHVPNDVANRLLSTIRQLRGVA